MHLSISFSSPLVLLVPRCGGVGGFDDRSRGIVASARVVLGARGPKDDADTESGEGGVGRKSDGHEDVGIHEATLRCRFSSFDPDRPAVSRWRKDDAMFEREDGRDSAQGYEAHGLIVGAHPDEDQLNGCPPRRAAPVERVRDPAPPARRRDSQQATF